MGTQRREAYLCARLVNLDGAASERHETEALVLSNRLVVLSFLRGLPMWYQSYDPKFKNSEFWRGHE